MFTFACLTAGCRRGIIDTQKSREGGGTVIRNAIQRFMYGRYGMDELGRALTWVGLGLLLISVPTDSAVANGLSLALYAAALFRMLSRNYAARRRENAKFLKVAGPAIRWWRLRRTMMTCAVRSR